MKNAKHTFLRSLLSLLLCFSMLLGTTYAWFTDSVSSVDNIIKSGNLDVAMYWAKDLASDDWKDVEDPNYQKIFDYDRWEPGYTEVRHIKIENEGDLAFKYVLDILPLGKVSILADVIDVFFLDPAQELDDRADLPDSARVGTLMDVIKGRIPVVGKLEEQGDKAVVTIALKMRESAGNEYQGLSIGDSFTVQISASQLAYESDAFGTDYDTEAGFGTFDSSYSAASTLDVANGMVANPVNLTDGTGKIKADIPEGVKLADGVTSVELQVTPMPENAPNITAKDGEDISTLDVHIEGVSEDNTTPIAVTLSRYFAKGLSAGNHSMYHVENDETIAMTLVSLDDIAAGVTPAHNSYTYDPATGDVVLYMANFSLVTALAAKESTWSGGVDYSWYSPGQTRYTISSADQLEAFARLVGGMAVLSTGTEIYPRDSFKGKVVKLACDINLGWEDGKWNGYTLNPDGSVTMGEGKEAKTVDPYFKPIGYYYTVDKDGKAETAGDVYSTVYSFEGTFDGGGNTIKNFYQNTWEIKGDYEGTYYKDAMGLFGYVVNGTVKNLTVENFSSDGEFTPTGVIAAYAVNSTFENINLKNCNPRVYNTGNGGIVGIGGNSDDPDNYKLVFKNITIDNTNKITALWGSWDVACGGLVGMFRGAGHVYMTDCHVAAQIDVFNDVCGNYQYYWYRYAGMLVGTNNNMVEKDGYVYPETEKYHAEGCTVHFGEWNDYYYCELVANSLASYTHDHQFSRLTEVKAVDTEKMKVTALDDTVTNIPADGRYNYVVVQEGKEGDEFATCYHFVDGKVWNHSEAGFETFDLDGNGKLDDLKEDRQHYYLPFNQLFTGYGWGVNYIPIYNESEKNVFDGVTILGREEATPVVKFASVATIPAVDCNEIKLGSLFKAVDQTNVPIKDASVYVRVANKDDAAVTATFTRASKWTNSVLKFSGEGTVEVTIQDYYYCEPTTITVNVRGHQYTQFVGRVTKADDPNGVGYELWGCMTCHEAEKIAANHEAGHHFDENGKCKCEATAIESAQKITTAKHDFTEAISKELELSSSRLNDDGAVIDGRWALTSLLQTQFDSGSPLQVSVSKTNDSAKRNYELSQMMLGNAPDGKTVSKVYISFEISSHMVAENINIAEAVLFSFRTTRKDGHHHQYHEIELSAKMENNTLYFVDKTSGTKEYVALKDGTKYTVNIEINRDTKHFVMTLKETEDQTGTTLKPLHEGDMIYNLSDYLTTVFRTNDFNFMADYQRIAPGTAMTAQSIVDTVGAIWIDNLVYECSTRDETTAGTASAGCAHTWRATELADETGLKRYTCTNANCGYYFIGVENEDAKVVEFAKQTFSKIPTAGDKLVISTSPSVVNFSTDHVKKDVALPDGTKNTMWRLTSANWFYSTAAANKELAKILNRTNDGDKANIVEISFDFMYTGDISKIECKPGGNMALFYYQGTNTSTERTDGFFLYFDKNVNEDGTPANNGYLRFDVAGKNGSINVEAGQLYKITLRMDIVSRMVSLYVTDGNGAETFVGDTHNLKCFLEGYSLNRLYWGRVFYRYHSMTSDSDYKEENRYENFDIYLDNVTINYEIMPHMYTGTVSGQ